LVCASEGHFGKTYNLNRPEALPLVAWGMAERNAIDYVKFYSRSHDAVIRASDALPFDRR
jgi:hypothetical protein